MELVTPRMELLIGQLVVELLRGRMELVLTRLLLGS